MLIHAGSGPASRPKQRDVVVNRRHGRGAEAEIAFAQPFPPIDACAQPRSPLTGTWELHRALLLAQEISKTRRVRVKGTLSCVGRFSCDQSHE